MNPPAMTRKATIPFCADLRTVLACVLFQHIPHTCRGASLIPEADGVSLRVYEKGCAYECETADR